MIGTKKKGNERKECQNIVQKLFVRLPIYCVYTWFLNNISTFLSFVTFFRIDRLHPPTEKLVPND